MIEDCRCDCEAALLQSLQEDSLADPRVWLQVKVLRTPYLTITERLKKHFISLTFLPYLLPQGILFSFLAAFTPFLISLHSSFKTVLEGPLS